MKNIVYTRNLSRLTLFLSFAFSTFFFNNLSAQAEDFDYRAYYLQQIEDCQQKLDNDSESMSERKITLLESRIANFEKMVIKYDEMMEMEEEDYYIDMGADFQNLSPAKKIKILQRQYEMDLISESNYLDAKAKLERQ